MHLTEITLRNWRSYSAATFKLPRPKGSRRVLLIGAMNGTGKTSLLMGLYLGLFGREAMPYLEGVRLGGSDDEKVAGYRQLMQRLLHRPALESDDPQASVQLTFEGDNDHVTITRTWHYTRGGVPRDVDTPDGEEIRIDDNGRIARPTSWQQANDKISELLFPSHVLPCFFFDGEQAQARVEAAGGAPLRSAVKALFGTGLVEELDQSLRGYISHQRSAVKRDVGDVRQDELDRKRRRRDEIEAELARIAGELEKLRFELDEAEGGRKARMAELTQLAGDTAVDIQLLSQRKLDLEREQQALFERLCDQLASLALPIALRKYQQQLLDQLNAEIIRDRWLLLRDETRRRRRSM